MIYIVGAGYIAREYAKVLEAMNEEFIVIGRGSEAVDKLKLEMDIKVVSGGLAKFIQGQEKIPSSVIVCTPVETLTSITRELLDFGVKKILIEKPGALTIEELQGTKKLAEQKNAVVLIGYNRRFYQATKALEKRLKEEKLIAANFEMTEWAHIIEKEPCVDEVKQRWVFSNTSHVIDLVSHIAGQFRELSSYTSGKLNWHEKSARFVGSGITDKDVLFSYCGYWDGPGRWSAEFITTENRYIFRPMEKLQVQSKGSVRIGDVENIDYSLDEEFKPGLFLQVKSFLSGDVSKLCTIESQLDAFTVYTKIANY